MREKMDNISELINKVFELKLPACNMDHMSGLVTLAQGAPEGCFVECGVARGGTAIVLSRVAQDRNRKIYLCDSFDGFPEPEEIDSNSKILGGAGKGYLTVDLLKGNFEKAGINTDNVLVTMGFFEVSMPKLKQHIDPIAFLHFDGDFYKSTIDVLDNLWEKVVPGGIVVFHDYPVYDGMKKAVEERFSLDEIKILTPGSCYVVKA
jgi:hypothetical protein